MTPSNKKVHTTLSLLSDLLVWWTSDNNRNSSFRIYHVDPVYSFSLVWPLYYLGFLLLNLLDASADYLWHQVHSLPRTTHTNPKWWTLNERADIICKPTPFLIKARRTNLVRQGCGTWLMRTRQLILQRSSTSQEHCLRSKLISV